MVGVVAGVHCGGGMLVGGTGCRGRAVVTWWGLCSSVGGNGSGPVPFDRGHDGGAAFVVGDRGLAGKWGCVCRPVFCTVAVVVFGTDAGMGVGGSRAVCVWVGVCECVVCGCEWCWVCGFGGSVGDWEHRLHFVGC